MNKLEHATLYDRRSGGPSSAFVAKTCELLEALRRVYTLCEYCKISRAFNLVGDMLFCPSCARKHRKASPLKRKQMRSEVRR